MATLRAFMKKRRRGQFWRKNYLPPLKKGGHGFSLIPICKNIREIKKYQMTAAARTHLVIADDHPLFRDALRQAVASVVSSAKIDEAGSFEDLTPLLERDPEVDLILLDLTMPGISGFSGLIYLRAQYPAI